MISIKINLLLIIIQILVMQFWLRSEFEELRNSIKSFDGFDKMQHLRAACHLHALNEKIGRN